MPGVIEAVWHGVATLADPALRVMLRRRVRRGKEIPARLGERRGIDQTPRPPGRLVWLHAASVGETMSMLPVVAALRQRHATVLVTTGTVTSARLFAQRCPDVLHRFVPLDVPRWAARFLDHWQPDAAAFIESELWPNLLAACRARQVGLMLLNARLSARSAAGWARAPGFARRVIGSFDCILARSEADAARFAALGGREVVAFGDLKFAAAPLPADPCELARLQLAIGAAPAWLAAATHPGEEAIAAAVHRKLAPLHPGLVTVIAPRHPERGPAIGTSLDAPRRSSGADPAPGLWIADTLGELGLLYRLFPIVFMGKSLVGHGGQNPLEPARLGCAVAAGPGMENFADAAAVLEACGALTRVGDINALAGWVDAMLHDPARRAAMGEAGRHAVEGSAGLPEEAARRLLGLMRD